MRHEEREGAVQDHARRVDQAEAAGGQKMVFYEFDSDHEVGAEKVIVKVRSPRSLAQYGRRSRVQTAGAGGATWTSRAGP